MYRILCLLAMITFIIEELLHQRMRRKHQLPSTPTDGQVHRHTPDRFDILRLLELLFLTLLLSTPAGNPSTAHGQLAMILTGLQISRLFGRRVLSRWSVLGALQGLEILLLLVLMLIPLSSDSLQYHTVSTGSLLALAGGVLFGITITLCSAFSLSYVIKLFSRESSLAYESFPPLADSENWAIKFSEKSLYAGTAGITGLFLVSGVSTLSILFSISVVLQATGLILSKRSNYSGHHPVSHIFWGIAFLLLLAMLISGITNLNFV